MLANPGRESRFRQLATSEPQHCRNDLSFRCLEFVAIEPQKHDHRYEGCPLVPISVGMIPGQSVAATSGKVRGINLSPVRPTMPGTCQCGLKSVLIPNPRQTPVVAQEVEMDGIEHEPVNPNRFPALRHGLFRQLPKGIPVFPRRVRRDR
jgi:hypothetical protein